MKALTEEAEKVGIESEKAELASVEKNTTKKKVRIVKKIVKKKIIRKVPKRVPVASPCNEIEKIASPNPNDNVPMETEASVVVPDLVVNESRAVEDMKELEDCNKDKDVRLVENSDCCRDESDRSGVETASLLGDQNQIELLDSTDAINTMDVEEHEDEDSVKEHDEKIFKVDVGGNEDTKVDESVQEQDERSECDSVKLEGGLSNGVREEEGMEKQVDNGEQSDAVEPEEVVNSETDGLKSEEGSSEIQVQSEEMIVSRLHMKQRAKVFIDGLDKETKEEDIRKVFEEVGKVVEVKLIRNYRSGKSRGYGFIRYASPDLATLALKKYNNVEIDGRLCSTAAIDWSDTILLNNIDKNWNNEHVLTLLKKIRIKNIDEVSVIPDPKNPNLNLGFAYLELETKKDAQIVYLKLQNKNVFGPHDIKVTWVNPLTDPVKKEMHENSNNTNNNKNKNFKSVYAENIPSTWDEEEVKGHFGRFGEIESIALAKNLWSTHRNDFAFINYKTCEGALSCIETLTCKKSTGGDGVKVSIPKSISKVKPMKGVSVSKSTVTEVKPKAFLKPHFKPQTQSMKISSVSSRHEDGRRKEESSSSSTTDELVRILREQASWKQGGPSLTTGMNSGHHHHHQQPTFGGKQPLTQMRSKSLYDDPQAQAYHQTHLQIPNPIPRPIGNGVGMASFHHFDPQRAHHTSGSYNAAVGANPRYFQTRDQPTYLGSSNIYRPMR